MGIEKEHQHKGCRNSCCSQSTVLFYWEMRSSCFLIFFIKTLEIILDLVYETACHLDESVELEGESSIPDLVSLIQQQLWKIRVENASEVCCFEEHFTIHDSEAIWTLRPSRCTKSRMNNHKIFWKNISTNLPPSLTKQLALIPQKAWNVWVTNGSIKERLLCFHQMTEWVIQHIQILKWIQRNC
jgi:hypothetical protein